MAVTRSTDMTMTTTTLTPDVRRKLKSIVLDLRHLLEAKRDAGGQVEGDFRRQLAAVGVDERGIQPLPAGRALSDEQQRVRRCAEAIISREQNGGAAPEQAYAYFLRESAFTFLNRVIGLRCLEARGLLLVDGQTETAITQQDELGGVPSLYWRVRNDPAASSTTTQPRDIWRETYRRACAAVSRDIRVLFDPESELAALFPLLPTMQRIVEALNDPAIPAAAYAEDALLGWVYQYFQSEEKDRIFADVRTKKKKIAGPDIIPVTQLYTEQYMVDFLLQNSLGRTWMEMYPDSRARDAWPYYVEPATPHTREKKPLRDWTILDPCVGSGHFLVVAFDLLAQLYAEERALAAAGTIPAEWAVPRDDVAQTILERNLYGIDIDRRATQLAALALYLKAKQTGLARPPRVINIVAADASYLAGDSWRRFLAGFQREPSVRRVLEAMATYLKDIRELGSLLRPEEELKRIIAEEHRKWEAAGRPQQAGLFPEYERPRQERLAFEEISDEAFWEHLAYRAEAAIQGFLDDARARGELDDQIVAGEAQRGFAFMELCQRRYDVVCTNPPYFGSRNMETYLRDYLAAKYTIACRDLYGAFMVRCQELARPGGQIGMVTQHGWMFLGSFTKLRERLVSMTTIAVIAHLGTKTFKDLSNTNALGFALFVLRRQSGQPTDESLCLRIVHDEDKEQGLRQSIAASRKGLIGARSKVFRSTREVFAKTPNTELFYWSPAGIRRAFLASRTLSRFVDARQGLITGDNERFLRAWWETTQPNWKPYAKGGPYRRWYGNQELVVDWSDDGAEIKDLKTKSGRQKSRPQNVTYYFREGGTWTGQSSYGFSMRYMPPGFIFDAKGPAFFAKSPDVSLPALIALANSKVIQFTFSALEPTIDYHEGYFMDLPAPAEEMLRDEWERLGQTAIHIKQVMSAAVVTGRFFAGDVASAPSSDLVLRARELEKQSLMMDGNLHSLEGYNDSLACRAYGLDEEDVSEVMGETGTPAGWHPLIAGYDALPELPADLPPVPQELTNYLAGHQRLALAPNELARLKGRLRALYQAGPGAKVEDEVEDANGSDGVGEDAEEGEGAAALGARIPIPAETFLEELSQKLEIHPISVYWLLEEMRREEGLVCPPELKRQMEDYASVTLLRQLGFRWPEQDKYEAEHGPIMDAALVVGDGIIPLVRCGGREPTAAERIRLRLERDFGEEGAVQSEAEFRQWVGRPLEDWLKRDCFKRHITQFKQRPIAWHLKSKEGTFQAFVLYHKLCDEATGRETLHRLRTQYAGGLIERLRAEQDQAKASKDQKTVTQLQLQIEDVEEFRQKLERIERGDTLQARIRCRWKGDEAKIGRPGPYAPDINDGVKVNIRPFQELGLLAGVVIKKWD